MVPDLNRNWSKIFLKLKKGCLCVTFNVFHYSVFVCILYPYGLSLFICKEWIFPLVLLNYHVFFVRRAET